MKNEIEKLYKLAGILKECLSPCYINKTWRKTHDCPNCDNRTSYPPFTAEKQLKLLELIIREDYGFEVTLENHRLIWISSLLNGSGGHEKLEDAIAGLIRYRWDNIDEAEQEEIRKILRG